MIFCGVAIRRGSPSTQIGPADRTGSGGGAPPDRAGPAGLYDMIYLAYVSYVVYILIYVVYILIDVDIFQYIYIYIYIYTRARRMSST